MSIWVTVFSAAPVGAWWPPVEGRRLTREAIGRAMRRELHNSRPGTSMAPSKQRGHPSINSIFPAIGSAIPMGMDFNRDAAKVGFEGASNGHGHGWVCEPEDYTED